MSPYKDSFCQPMEEKKGCSSKECQRKIPNGRPRVIVALSWVFLLFMVLLLSVKIVYLSTQVEEQRLQLETIKGWLGKRVPSHDNAYETQNTKQGTFPDSKLDSKTWNEENDYNAYEDTDYMDETPRSKRTKRSGVRQRFRGPCHLEATVGPGIYNPIGDSLQKPESAMSPILWKRPDNQPPSRCQMKVMEGRHGVEHIKIHRRGFYFVYAQVTYRVHPWKMAGHRVVLKKNSLGEGETLMMTIAPERGNFVTPTPAQNERLDDLGSSDSRYTGGVFYFDEGDILGVYPMDRDLTLETSDEKSYFGLMFYG